MTRYATKAWYYVAPALWSDSYGDYSVWDRVSYDDGGGVAYYECILDHTAAGGKEPTNATYWKVVIISSIDKVMYDPGDNYRHTQIFEGYGVRLLPGLVSYREILPPGEDVSKYKNSILNYGNVKSTTGDSWPNDAVSPKVFHSVVTNRVNGYIYEVGLRHPYVSDNSFYTPSYIRKKTLDGDEVWGYQAPVEHTRFLGLALDSQGNVYACAQERAYFVTKLGVVDTLYKLNGNGSLLWSVDPGITLLNVAVGVNDCVIAVGLRSGGNTAWCYDSGGNLLWSVDTGDYYQYPRANAVAVKPSTGDVYIGFQSREDTPNDVCIKKYDSDGNFISNVYNLPGATFADYPTAFDDTGCWCLTMDSNEKLFAVCFYQIATWDPIGEYWEYWDCQNLVKIDTSDDSEVWATEFGNNESRAPYNVDGWLSAAYYHDSGAMEGAHIVFDDSGNCYIPGYENIVIDSAGTVLGALGYGFLDFQLLAGRALVINDTADGEYNRTSKAFGNDSGCFLHDAYETELITDYYGIEPTLSGFMYYSGQHIPYAHGIPQVLYSIVEDDLIFATAGGAHWPFNSFGVNIDSVVSGGSRGMMSQQALSGDSSDAIGNYRVKVSNTWDSAVPDDADFAARLFCTDLFERLGSAIPYGNANWNDVPEFANSVPHDYTVAFTAIEDSSHASHSRNGVFHLRKDQNIPNKWFVDVVKASRQVYVEMTLLQDDDELGSTLSDEDQVSRIYMDVGTDNVFDYSSPLVAANEQGGAIIVMENVVNEFNIASGKDGHDGNCSTYPGKRYEWNILTDYVTGVIIAWEGDFYQANNDNIGDEPPSGSWTLLT